MSTPTVTDEHRSPDYAFPDVYATPSASGPGGPPTSVPFVPSPRRPRRARMTALLVAGALACSATGAATAQLLDDDAPVTPAAVASTLQRSATTVTGAARTTVTGTPESAAATVGPSVVTIAVTGTQTTTSPFGQAAQQRVSGTGSGIVLRADGYVLTNNHVVSAAVDGGTVDVTFSDGTSAPAKIVGTDPSSDLAVIKVTGVSDLTPATFGDSDALAVGQAVLAVGAPLGLSNTVTEGIVSTLHRPVRTGEEGASEQSVIDAVQTDAAINPGNSGGALVDLAGHVVGINSAIATAGDGSSGNIGVGFAIPANSATEVADELIADGTADHPQLGISVGDATTTSAGATVRQTTAGGPAAEGRPAGR